MTTQSGQTRRIMTPAEREGLAQRLKDEDADNRAGHKNLYIPQDVGTDPTVRETRRRMERTMQNGAPIHLNQREKAQAEKEANKIGEWLTGKMVPKNHVSVRRVEDPLRFRKYVNEMSKNENSPQFCKMAQKWKQLRRKLDPDDPNAANLEQIRPTDR